LIKEVRAIPFGKLLQGEPGDAGATHWRDKGRPDETDGGDAEPEDHSITYEVQIAKDKVRMLIGLKGATINEISRASRCRLTIDKEAEGELASVFIQPLPAGVSITGAQGTPVSKQQPSAAGDVSLAVKLITESIDERARNRKEGIFPGAVLHARVARLMDFGAFVALPNGKEGLVHISELDHEHVERVSDFLSEGDELYVVVLSVDERGRARMSLKDVDQETGVYHGLMPTAEAGDARDASSALDPASLDDQNLFPALDAVQKDGGSNGSVVGKAGGGGEGGLDQSRQEWKTRIREQREKAAREASMGYAHPPPPPPQQQPAVDGRLPQRHRHAEGQHERQMRPGGGGGGAARGGGGGGGGRLSLLQGADRNLAPRHSRQVALADEDYR